MDKTVVKIRIIIPFVITIGNDYVGNGEDGGWEEVSTSLKETLRLLETPRIFLHDKQRPALQGVPRSQQAGARP